jgi:ubiquinone/menaquinone biosynthesis C-methylase UbiE
MNKQVSGRQEVWDRLWSGHQTSYSETAITQWDVFDSVKWAYLRKLLPKGGSILECGCGGARMSVYAAKAGFAATMVDISAEALRVARNNFAKEHLLGRFVRARVEKLPFKDASFDAVMSHGLLEHLDDIETPLSEMSRVLKKGGLLYADIAPRRLSIQTAGDLFSFTARVFYHLIALKPLKIRRDLRVIFPEYHDNGLSHEDYRLALNACGLKNVKVIGDRPFPYLSLPHFIERYYLNIMQKSYGLWKKFDGSPLALRLGAGWWVYGWK